MPAQVLNQSSDDPFQEAIPIIAHDGSVKIANHFIKIESYFFICDLLC